MVPLAPGEDGSSTRKKKLEDKLNAALEEYHKRKHENAVLYGWAGRGATSSYTTSAKRRSTESPTPMEIDGTIAEVEVDYTEDTFEC